MLKQRQIDVEYRKDTEKRLRASEDEKQKCSQLAKMHEHKASEKDKAIESLQSQLRAVEQKNKIEKEKLIGERKT